MNGYRTAVARASESIQPGICSGGWLPMEMVRAGFLSFSIEKPKTIVSKLFNMQSKFKEWDIDQGISSKSNSILDKVYRW